MKNYDCTTCTRPDCIHRDCYRRLSTDVGGLDLCPGHVAAEPVKPDTEIVSKIEALKEWEALQAEAAAMVESIKDEIKKHMDSIGVETLEAGPFVARFTTVQSSRFDTRRFKNEIGEDVYKRFCKEVISRRFTVSA